MFNNSGRTFNIRCRCIEICAITQISGALEAPGHCPGDMFNFLFVLKHTWAVVYTMRAQISLKFFKVRSPEDSNLGSCRGYLKYIFTRTPHEIKQHGNLGTLELFHGCQVFQGCQGYSMSHQHWVFSSYLLMLRDLKTFTMSGPWTLRLQPG